MTLPLHHKAFNRWDKVKLFLGAVLVVMSCDALLLDGVGGSTDIDESETVETESDSPDSSVAVRGESPSDGARCKAAAAAAAASDGARDPIKIRSESIDSKLKDTLLVCGDWGGNRGRFVVVETVASDCMLRCSSSDGRGSILATYDDFTAPTK
ncbi:hypothetical protein G7Y89_g5228 [Cudoniella acicularis]|uniref:Uncharacterized protein n=1 Tax=Cudoniella acicularis TaxID=354080 RepID=A0A8H4RMU5_9HELO|nr:hypothetical protein G7Y89_g5228 [Cudoniella acicularis]